MFVDFSNKKIRFLGIVVLALLVATGSTLLIAASVRPAMHVFTDSVQRARAELYYLIRFKLPEAALAAVAGSSRTEARSATSSMVSAQSVPVLLYHGEGDSASMPPTHVFVEHMRALRDAGWHTITMEQFKAFMKGTGTVPDKSFLLTFDDGRSDAFYSADPLLKDFGYTAVMFVITGFSMPGDSDVPLGGFYLSKAQLDYMVRSGRWDLESHGDQDHRTYSVPTATSTAQDLTLVPGQHFLSNFFWLPNAERIETPAEFVTRVTNDLTTAKTLLENNFDITVDGFAYPLNDLGQDSVNAPQAGALLTRIVPTIYSFDFYQTWPGNGDFFNHPDPNVHLIKRIEPTASWSSAHLLAVLNGGVVKSLPHTAFTFGPAWKSNWGTVRPSDAELELSASEDSTGASAFLDGSGTWTDYKMDASVDWKYGTFSLLARYTAQYAPYVVCAFSNNRIYLEWHDGEKLETIAYRPYVPPALPAKADFSMSVQGDTVSCSAYGVRVASSVAGISRSGGVGATVWTPSAGEAKAVLTRLAVEPL